MWLVVRVEWHHVGQHVGGGVVVPVLTPLELQVLGLGQPLLDRVVGPLDQHVVKADPLEEVGHGGGHAEGVDGPAVVGLEPEVLQEHQKQVWSLPRF